MKKTAICAFMILMLTLAACGPQSSSNQEYSSKRGQSLTIKGSDTMAQVVSNLAEAYAAQNPAADISVTGGGSGVGIAALINGEADIADSSRAMKSSEIEQAKAAGKDPQEYIIGWDTLSIIVHENNPITALTIAQISGIYKGEITNWKEVGGNDEKITLYGRQSTSGTYIYFLEEVVKGDYATSMRNLEGSQQIIEAVRQDTSGVGYVGIGYLEDAQGNAVGGIRILKVAKEEGMNPVDPLNKNTFHEYPISRALYLYTPQKPSPGDPAHPFLTFIASEKGQKVIEESGFVRLEEESRLALSASLT